MLRRKKGRTEITIETREITTIRMRDGWPGLRYCPVCRQGVGGLTRAQAAVIFQIEERLIGELYDLNEIHGVQDAAVCGNALARYISRNDPSE